MSPVRRRLHTLEFGACAVLALLAAAWFHSASLFPLQRLTRYENDPAQMVWNLWMARHEVLAGHSPFHTQLIFPPGGANLAHHMLVSGYLPLTLLATRLGGDEVGTYIVAYNVAMWLSLAATFLFMYLLAREASAPPIAAAGVAVAVGMSSFFKANLQNLNHASSFFVPLIFWLALLVYRYGSRRALYALAGAGALAVYFTETIAYVGMVGVAALALWLAWASGRSELRARVRDLGLMHLAGAVLLAAAISAPFFIPFFAEAVPAYPLAEHSRYSANLAGYFVPTIQMSPHYFPAIAPLAARVTKGVDGTWVFLGYPLVIAAVFGLMCLRLRERIVLGGLIVVFLVLGLGPYLKCFGTEWTFRLPYAWLLDHGPLRGSRTPARLVQPVIVLLGLAAAVGWGCWAARCVTTVRRALFMVVALAWGGWVCYEVYSEAAPKQRWTPPEALRHLPAGTVLTLPFEMVDGYVGLTQVVHGQPTMSGAVVRISPEMNKVWWPVNNAIDAGGEAMQAMIAANRIRTVVVRPDLPFDARSERHLQRSLEMAGVVRIDARPAPSYFEGTPAEAPTPAQFAQSKLSGSTSAPLVLARTAPFAAREMELSLEPERAWECSYFSGNKLVSTMTFESPRLPGSSMTVRRLPFPDGLRDAPFDRLVLRPLQGRDGRIGHIHFR